MLEVRGLTKHFLSIPAVDGVSFTAAAGEVTGYLGPNGSGKSTTVKMITGLIEPTGGEIYYRGVPVLNNMTDFKRVIGYVPEEPYLYPYLTGAEYLELAGQLRLISLERLWYKIEHFLKLFNLWEDRFTPISSYSKGMRQKILLAGALLDDPEIVILDEPFSGLDVNSGLILRRMIQGLAAAGKVVLFSSHEMDTVEKICSRVVILHKGKIVANDSVEHLRTIMELPTLEEIYTQVATVQDTSVAAGELLAVMRR